MSTEPLRKFYKQARASEDNGVMLDERRLRTPNGAVFAAPTAALAEAVAAEWNAQGAHILPAAMPLTQFAFAAIDHAPARRADLVAHIARFAETDLLCHRAEAPVELVTRQQALWSGPLDWAAAFSGATLPVVAGIVAARVPAGELAKIRAAAEALDDFRLTAMAQAAGLSGSAVIALALVHGALEPEAAFEAAALDDLWSLEHWGEDAEARARLERQRAEFQAIGRFLQALSG
ncbi:MAG: ATP12 family protein [Hyphomonadaceae bacterium]